MEITAEIAGQYFARLWRLYTSQWLAAVEAFPFVASCPFKGSLNWTPEGWHVLADASGGAEAMFRTLMHELAHVVNGDVWPHMKHARTVEQRRALAKGEALVSATEQHAHVTAKTRGRQVAYPNVDDAEAEADAWAYSKASMAWQVLTFRDSIAEAVEVMRVYGGD